jgi:hypothetical protein
MVGLAVQELQQTGEDYAKRHAMLKTMMDRNASTSAALGALTHAHQAKAPVALVGLREYGEPGCLDLHCLCRTPACLSGVGAAILAIDS